MWGGHSCLPLGDFGLGEWLRGAMSRLLRLVLGGSLKEVFCHEMGRGPNGRKRFSRCFNFLLDFPFLLLNTLRKL